MRPRAARWHKPVDRIGQKIAGTREMGHATWTHPVAPLAAGHLPLDAIPAGHPTFDASPNGAPSADVISDGTPSFDVIPDGPQGRAGIQTGAPQVPLDPRFRGDDSKKNVALLCPLERHRGRCAAPGRPALPDGTQF